MTPAIPATPSTARSRIDRPASASIASHTVQKMIVLPKSGCCISNAAMTAVSSADRGTPAATCPSP